MKLPAACRPPSCPCLCPARCPSTDGLWETWGGLPWWNSCFLALATGALQIRIRCGCVRRELKGVQFTHFLLAADVPPFLMGAAMFTMNSEITGTSVGRQEETAAEAPHPLSSPPKLYLTHHHGLLITPPPPQKTADPPIATIHPFERIRSVAVKCLRWCGSIVLAAVGLGMGGGQQEGLQR
uniref:Uncharacterized protein n=1 Tax=Knipowitschia caucasica TaxID=637954 RepID=A0AAV2MQZ6_KNICA